MAIAITLKEYLADTGVSYELIRHAPTGDSRQTAEMAHIPTEYMAKAVLLEDDNGRYLMAILPANRHVDLGRLHRRYHLQLGLATESELEKIFDDCAPGAVPPVGEAYGVDVIYDRSLDECPDVYFEGGDHVHLVHLSSKDFRQLIPKAIHSDISAS